MRFQDIPGLNDIKSHLISAFENNRIAHAQLFSGIEGSGAFPLSIAFATFLLCKNKSHEDACGQCENCQRMEKFIHPDVHFFYPKPSSKSGDYDKAFSESLKKWREMVRTNLFPDLNDWIAINGFENKNILISKEDSRKIIKTVSMKSFEGDFKILFIWYPERMHPSAANAMLKVLEEPPTQTIYFMITNNYEGLLSTITSRTQLISVPPFKNEEIENILITQKNVSPEKAAKVSHLANGSMSKAYNELESVGEIAYEKFQSWMRSCHSRNYSELITQSESFAQSSKPDQKGQLEYAISLIRESVLFSSSNGAIPTRGDQEGKFIRNFGNAVSFSSLEKIAALLNETIGRLERNANPRISYMTLSIQFCDLLQRK